jgi:hypothetical protein
MVMGDRPGVSSGGKRLSDNRKWVKYILLISLLSLSVWYVVSELLENIDWLRAELESPDQRFWIGCILVLIPYAIYPMVWSQILRGCGAEMPHGRAVSIWWTTNMAKYIPGKVWFVTGRAWVARRWGTHLVIESFAWEFVIGISSALIAGTVLLLHDGSPVIWGRIVLLLAIASLLPLVSPELTQRIIRHPIHWFGGGDQPSEISMSRSRYLGALLLMTSNWFVWGFALQLLCAGIGLDVPYLLLVSSYSLAWGMGYATLVTPAGLGVREGGLTFLLASSTVAGTGVLIAILSRSVSLVVELGLFGIGLLTGGLAAGEEEE